MLKKRKSKGFTIIELVVVIAVLAILVLLATPRFSGYVESAKLAQIKNDIKAHETHIELKLATEPGFVDDWGVVSRKQMEELRSSSKLYDKKGLIEESSEVIFTYQSKIIPKKMIKTRLKGTFILDYENKVYYYDGEVEPVERLACEEAELQGYICIYTVEDLKNIYQDLSAKYILMNDLDLSSISNWKPIGHETGKILKFTGEFNGNNYSIENFKINESEWNLWSYGLFSDVENATFENINMLNPSILAKIPDGKHVNFISPLVGRSLGDVIFDNISIEGFNMPVNPASFVGAISGDTVNSSFDNIFINNSKTLTHTFTGALTGRSVNSNYKNIVVSNSEINGGNNSTFVGGVVGDSTSSILNDVRILNSSITGGGFVGGIIGIAREGSHDLSNINSKANVEGEGTFVGGVVGKTYGEFNIKKVDIDSEVVGEQFLGGIAGEFGNPFHSGKDPLYLEDINVNTKIKFSNSAHLEGKELFASGGIAGSVSVNNETEFKIKNANVSGDINAKQVSGGIIGYFRDYRGGYGQPTPIQKSMYFENVSSNVNFIENPKPLVEEQKGYIAVGGIVGIIPEEGTIKLNLKDVSYTGDMGLSEFYEITEDNPITSVIWRQISPIVSLSSVTNSEEYIEKWKSLVKTDNVYWIEENSPRLKPFDLIGLGR